MDLEERLKCYMLDELKETIIIKSGYCDNENQIVEETITDAENTGSGYVFQKEEMLYVFEDSPEHEVI